MVEKIPNSEAEKKNTEKEEKRLIEIITSPNRKLTEEEIKERRKIIEEIEKEKRIREKLRQNESLTSEEVKFLIEIERKKAMAQEKTKKVGEEKKEEALEKKEVEKVPEGKEKISEEKVEKKTEEEKREREEELNEKREEYRDAYFGAVKIMEKKEMQAFRKIRSESEEEIKKRVKEILEEKPEEVEKNKKEFMEFLKRQFEEKGITISKEKAEKILEVELKKGEYDRAKIEWVRAMKEAGMEDQQIIGELTREVETLKALEIEKWPPEKKSIFAKALDGWIKLPRGARIILSAGVITSVGILFPEILPSTAALCAKYGILGTVGFRLGRGFLSSSIAQVIGGTFEKFWGFQRIEKKKSESLRELAEKGINPGNFEELDRKIQEILDETAKSRRRMKIAKGLLMLAAGSGASMALTVAAEEVFTISIHKEAILETKLKSAVSETVPRGGGEVLQEEAGSSDTDVETVFTEKYLGVETVEKGESLLSEAKKIYMEHAQELGYKGDLTNKIALEKWAKTLSTRHIVGQYIVEHQEEFKSLIGKIGAPPKPDDPEYFSKLDEWLHKVPKSTFEDILHNKIPNLVYEGENIVVTKSGDILILSPEGRPRFGHILVTEMENKIFEGKKTEILEGLERREEIEIHTGFLREEVETEEMPMKEISTSEELRKALWEKFGIVGPAYERIQNERILDLITETKHEHFPGILSGVEDDVVKNVDILRNHVLKIYNSLSLKERAEVQLMSVDEFLKKYFDKILERK